MIDWAIHLVAGAYALWQSINYRYWKEAVATDVPAPSPAELPLVSIVVPFRNEAGRLPDLLASLLGQQYPADRYEIILVDDHSTDGFSVSDPRIQLLRLAEFHIPPGTVAYKKLALTHGIARARGQYIVTTDADCQWSPNTLSGLAGCFRAGAEVVLGPVFIAPVDDLCSAFQALDLAGYQLFTAASVRLGRPTLANGAHFAFSKAAFGRAGGYAGVDHLPSGDDVLLLHKFGLAGARVQCLTDPATVVTTLPVGGWGALWQQRLRWAGKAGAYTSPLLSFAQALAFLTSLAIVVGLFFAPPAAFLAWAMKAVADYLLLRSVCRHYGRPRWMRYFPAVQLIYPFYLVAIGSAALLGVKAPWKGRAGS